jgi:glycosyltransferase involved in cell wall biosynthesis
MISIVVPVFNEEESLSAFFSELTKVLPKLDKKHEIIFIDDGSTDNSLEVLKTFNEKDKNVRVFSFRKNLGKSEALTFGFMQAKGDYIITLDADLQDRPTEIHKLLDKAKSGIDLVSGFRQNQKRPIFMIAISKVFNSILKELFDLNIHDYNCGLKVYTKETAKNLRLYGGLHRFIPLLAYEQGFAVEEVQVEHDVRRFGKSKYGFSKLWTDLPDLFSMLFLTKYAKKPLHFFGTMGGLLLIIGVSIFIYLSFVWFQGESIGRRPLFFTSIMLILGGLQIFFTGFLADLIISISHAKQVPSESHIHFPLKYSSENE